MDNTMAYGRKLKGATRRVPITVHAPLDRLDQIDSYVEERSREDGKAYSRSDFYEEAAKYYLEYLGKLPEQQDGTTGVPK